MKKILVRTPQWLGDAVVSTVFLDRLKRLETESQITVLCTSGLHPLFESHPAVYKALALPYPEGNVFEVGKMIQAAGFDEAYVLPRSFRAAFEAFLGKVPRRVGYRGDLRRLLLTESLRYDENRLYAHRYLALIKQEQLPLSDVRPHFPVQEPRDKKFTVLKHPVLGIAPVSIAPSRTWLPDRFAETANQWKEKTGGSVVLFGSAKERAVVQHVADRIPGAINSSGDLTLPELGWMIQHCDLFLGNDSGLMHVAGAFQTPGVIVFGASDPSKALPPWGRLKPLQHTALACVPCLRNHCVRRGNGYNECLSSVTTEQAFTALSGRSR